jgi:glycosyltransferase involved in cell wall biosynthesis
MRIAHVLSSLAMGGQERVALDLAAAQVKRGHDVAAISLAPLPHGALAGAFETSGVAIHSVPKGASFDGGLIVRLAKLLRRERIDVVHTHNPQPLAYGAPAGRLARTGIVHTKHGANPDRGRRLWLRRATGHLAHAYVAVSEATAEIARANRECAPSRLHVIANGVDLEAYRPDEVARREVRSELGIPADAYVLGTVGRVSLEKDHALLVRAAGPLLGPGLRLVIAGDGAELANVRTAARAFEPWVVLTGVRHDAPRVLASFDAFVLSSRSEGLPLALLEAMACALPIVATDVGGVADVVDHGRAGVLVPPRDEEALRRAMARLVGDRGAAAELGARARARSRRYDAAAVVDRYMDLYRAVVA